MSKEKPSRSDPLALEQFFSTFLLLGSGILLAVVLLLLERAYCMCHRPINRLMHFDDQPSTRAAAVRGCCSLLSRVRHPERPNYTYEYDCLGGSCVVVW